CSADWREKDKAVIDAIQAVLSESPQAGFWKCYYRLRFKGFTFNHKRVYRVYCWLGLNLKRRIKKTLPKRENKPLSVVNRPDIQCATTGKPQQNGFIERFNGSFRRKFLNAYLFESLSQVRDMAWFWQQDYNQNRTHESLGHLPPETYRKQPENSKQVCL
ncbi:transposase, partial [Yersinia enterocolitica]|nr:transposase [Yersinia enterocolitica]